MDRNTRSSERPDLFGNYKAEWLGDRLFTYFRRPAYFPDLMRPRPCVLVGGRGTGKTTVLRCLSYEGRFALEEDKSKIEEWAYYGFYYRVNTNRVSAFQGAELPSGRWQKLFGHYVNLLLTQKVVKFLRWYDKHSANGLSLDSDLCFALTEALNIEEAHDLKGVSAAIRRGLAHFESALNNIKSEQDLRLSLQGAPLDVLFEGLREMPEFAEKSFFFLIDEYENLLDDQQVVFNTLVKHASDDYTFKIGVRELGWRRRNTLAETEELTSPADYVRIDISVHLSGSQFDEFAREVCDARLKSMFNTDQSVVDLFPGVTAEEEAEFLGAERITAPIRKRIRVFQDLRVARAAETLSDLDILLIRFRMDQKKVSLEGAIREKLSNSESWRNFEDNYRFALLFQIAKPGSSITKLYCGWSTFTTMAASNIRYLLELVDYTFREHDESGQIVGEPFSWRTQTKAAQAVGRKNLFELEGFREGARLVKLTLGLGRLFGLVARNPVGHAPEQNQFALPASDAVPVEVEHLLQNATMHLALIRSIGNKLNKTDARSYDYRLHPIYSAFFGISHRRKRKIVVEPDDLWRLVTDPAIAVRQLYFAGSGEPQEPQEPLPEQLRLFEAYFSDPEQ